MKKSCFIFVLMIAIFSSVFGFSASTLKPAYASSNAEIGNFEIFSSQLTSLISTYDIEDYDNFVFDTEDDLSKSNNALMVKSDTFNRITGSRITKDNDNTFSITNNISSIDISTNDNLIFTDSDEIYSLSQPAELDTNNNLIFPIEDVAKSMGYEIELTNAQLRLTRPYQTKRLIVKSNNKIDTQNAIASVSGYNDLHILQYATEEDTINALEYYNTLNSVSWAEVDSIFVAQGYEEEQAQVNGLNDSFSYSSWGAEAMGVESYSDYLLNTVGNSNLNEVIIAVLDTGIDTDHEWFNGRIASGGQNYSSSISATSYAYEDVYGHGTHVAGIICDLTLSNVKILPIKVMSDNGYGYASQIMLGVNYVTQLKNSGRNIYAMNLSLGSANGIGSDEHRSYSEALTNAYNNGILPVVAAGNDGADVTNHTPANIECVITVSAIGISGPLYYRPSWSNYGSFIDVAAPGYQILSAKVGGGTVRMSGTSMAAPHIAGAVALLMSDSTQDYTLTELETLLDVNTVDLGDDGWDTFYGEGLVNLEYAYADLIADVTFSNTNSDSTEPFNLTLSSSEPSASIYYTTDGTVPTTTNGTLYSSPILVNTTQRIKARAYVLSAGEVVKYSKVSQMTYCFYGQDIEGAFVASADGTLTSYNGILTNVTVPMVVNNVTITKIGTNAFTSSSVVSVTLPSTVETIGSNAFAGCSTIQTVYGPNVKLIDMYAFNGCSSFKYATDAYFPELLTIGKYAFYQCKNMRPISLSKLEKVDYYGFCMKDVNATYLTSVSLPNAKIIGDMAFFNCQYLATINLPSAEIICANTFRECDLINVYLPSAKYVGNYSFYVNENLLTVDMPEVLVVGTRSFYYYCTSLHTVDMPKVQKVGSMAFRICNALTTLNIPEIQETGDWAFDDCRFAELFAPKLRYIGRNSFSSNVNLRTVNIPNVVYINAGAFRSNTGLTTVTLSACLEDINDTSFTSVPTTCEFNIYSGTPAKNFVVSNGYVYNDLSADLSYFTYNTVNGEIHITGFNGTLPNNTVIPSYINELPVTRICASAFENCLTINTLSLPFVKTIEESAFAGCENLTTVYLSRIEAIGQNAFNGCISLNEIEIENVTTVGRRAFYGCSALLSVKFSQNITNIGTEAFGYSSDELLIPTFVIYGYIETAAKDYADNLNITFRGIFNNLEHFYYNTYENQGKIELLISFVDSYTTGNIIIPSSYNGMTISKIGDQAFYQCCLITGIILPDTIKTIGNQSFYECSNLESITLDYVTSIGSHSFYGCESLKTIYMPLVENIPTYAFNGCEALTSVNIPFAKTLEDCSFYECYNLTTVICPNLESVGWASFTYDSKLSYIDTLNIKVLGTVHGTGVITGSVFSSCNKLTTFYLPKIETMGTALFPSTMTKIVIGKNLTTIFQTPITSSATIYGYSGTMAETYATDNSKTFVAIDEFEITSDLQQSITKNISDECSLTIGANGFDIKYQWFTTLTNNITDGVAIFGETSQTLSIDTSISGVNKYFVKMINWDGTTDYSNICTVTVNSAAGTYTITASTGLNGSISPTGSVVVEENRDKKFTFSPNTGYHVETILVDGIALTGTALSNAITNGYEFANVTTHHTIAVSFAINTYTITVAQASNGSISQALASYNYGTNAIFTITADLGYQINKLIVDSLDITEGDLTTYTFSNISDNHTITAVFGPIDNISYTVNHWQEALSSEGAILFNSKYYTRYETDNTLSGATNSQTQAVAKVYTGFTSQPFNQTSISANGNTIINIYYNRNSYSVSLQIGTGIETVAGAGTYLYGASVSISASLSQGYNWTSWNNVSGDTVKFSEINHTFEMPATPLSLVAKATIRTFTITVSAGQNGTISPSGNVVVNYGTNKTFDFIPSEGYHVKSVTIDTVNIGDVHTYTFLGVNSSHTLSVVFEINKYSIVIPNSQNGSVFFNGSISDIPEGSSRTFTISPNEGYEVDKVTINGNEIVVKNNSFTVSEINSNMQVNVTYKTKSTVIPDDPNGGGTTDADNPSETGTDTENKDFKQYLIIGGITLNAILLLILIIVIAKRKKRAPISSYPYYPPTQPQNTYTPPNTPPTNTPNTNVMNRPVPPRPTNPQNPYNNPNYPQRPYNPNDPNKPNGSGGY
ncbi:MAG: leucine-rich repeat protein [Clostridia bacterium]|nr:leucine-rich repeat protein [Clostridia bacterium]